MFGFEKHNLNVVQVQDSTYKLPREFVWTIILVMAIVLQYVATIYLVTMRARIAAFRRKFMHNFDAEHKKAFPEKDKAPQFGYPDSGNGRFGKKLSYKEWFEMACGQRCQINFLEHLHYAILAPLIIGLVYPTAATVIASFIFIGRLLFTIGYSTQGPSGRMVGALTMDLALFVGFGYLIAAALALGK